MNIDINKLHDNLYKQGLEQLRIKDIIEKAREYKDYISIASFEDKDYIDILKILEYANFFARNCPNPTNISQWNDLLVYSDDDVKIWNPITFIQASLIGLPIWCICYNEGYWNEHVNIKHENVFMIYNVFESGNQKYTCCLVSPYNRVTIYDCEHNRLDNNQIVQYLNSLGCGKAFLKPQQLITENNQYKTNIDMK